MCDLKVGDRVMIEMPLDRIIAYPPRARPVINAKIPVTIQNITNEKVAYIAEIDTYVSKEYLQKVPKDYVSVAEVEAYFYTDAIEFVSPDCFKNSSLIPMRNNSGTIVNQYVHAIVKEEIKRRKKERSNEMKFSKNDTVKFKDLNENNYLQSELRFLSEFQKKTLASGKMYKIEAAEGSMVNILGSWWTDMWFELVDSKINLNKGNDMNVFEQIKKAQDGVNVLAQSVTADDVLNELTVLNTELDKYKATKSTAKIVVEKMAEIKQKIDQINAFADSRDANDLM